MNLNICLLYYIIIQLLISIIILEFLNKLIIICIILFQSPNIECVYIVSFLIYNIIVKKDSVIVENRTDLV
ncbi:hypothetical protein HMPREF9709_00752 [Helcococcus kunzii ATCC 51366]|uniref:Uncharacterized protein n=1 Tax=Helcococcus kunzii ATCC 51366 TaxID=883114 RepID=H3NN41_9FIRM|nr:hypothetical protein HMPREF9709_00752 [Helcococcus kunzii ATCC 51366]